MSRRRSPRSPDPAAVKAAEAATRAIDPFGLAVLVSQSDTRMVQAALAGLGLTRVKEIRNAEQAAALQDALADERSPL